MRYVIPIDRIIGYITDCFPFLKTTHKRIKEQIPGIDKIKFYHHTYVFEGNNISYRIKGYVFEASFPNNFNCPCRQKIIVLRDTQTKNLYIDTPLPACTQGCLKNLPIKIVKIVITSNETKAICKSNEEEIIFFLKKPFAQQ